MKLIPEWRRVIKKAWVVKFNIAAALFGAAEVVVAIWKPAGMPNGVFAGIAAVISICSNVVRVLAQQEISGEMSAREKVLNDALIEAMENKVFSRGADKSP